MYGKDRVLVVALEEYNVVNPPSLTLQAIPCSDNYTFVGNKSIDFRERHFGSHTYCAPGRRLE